MLREQGKAGPFEHLVQSYGIKGYRLVWGVRDAPRTGPPKPGLMGPMRVMVLRGPGVVPPRPRHP